MIPLNLQQEAVNLIQRSKKVLIIPSAPVDGDCLGSAISLLLALKKLGKEATVVCTETIPNVYSFLPGIALVEKQFQFVQDLIVTIDCRNAEVANVTPDIQKDRVNIIITPKKGKLDPSLVSFQSGGANFDLIITVDAGSVDQFKTIYEANTEMFKTIPVLNIDHHVSNENFGRVNVVDVMAPSATTLVTNIIEMLGSQLMDADIATLLLAGLITDTGSFQNPNTTPDAFSIAAHLIESGARQQEIIQHIYKTKQLSTLKLWGRVLSKLQFDEKHRLVWSTISRRDLTDTQARPEESEGVIDELMSNAPGADIVVLLKDRGDGLVSGSIRTISPQLSASMLAEKFGGGGHLQAAGFKVGGKTLEEIESWVVETLKQFQQERLQPAIQDKVEAARIAQSSTETPMPKALPTKTEIIKSAEAFSVEKNPARTPSASAFPSPMDMV